MLVVEDNSIETRDKTITTNDDMPCHASTTPTATKGLDRDTRLRVENRSPRSSQHDTSAFAQLGQRLDGRKRGRVLVSDTCTITQAGARLAMTVFSFWWLAESAPPPCSERLTRRPCTGAKRERTHRLWEKAVDGFVEAGRRTGWPCGVLVRW